MSTKVPSRPPPSPEIDRAWREVVGFLQDPTTRDRVSPATARRLLELHHRLDGFELPAQVERLAAERLGLEPAAAARLFDRAAPGPNPLEATSFRELGRMLVDDLLGLVRALPMGPIRGVAEALRATREVLDRSSQPHLSKAEKKAVRAHFDALHEGLRQHMAEAQATLGGLDQARAKLLSNPTGAPIAPAALDERGQKALARLDAEIADVKDRLGQLGHVGLAFTTLRGESFWEQNWIVLSGGLDVTAFMPVASAGLGAVREIAVRDPKTGRTEVKDSVAAIGLLTHGFGRKVVSVDDLGKGKWRDVLSQKGMGGGISPIPFINIVRDPIVGDVFGVFVPGLLFAQLNARPDGNAGFGGGFVFGIPGLPAGPTVSGSWNHPIFQPLVGRAIAPLTQIFSYLIRGFQLGVSEPISAAADAVRARLDRTRPDAGTPPV